MADKSRKKKIPQKTSYIGGRRFKGELPPDLMPKAKTRQVQKPVESGSGVSEKASEGRPSKP